MHVLILCVCLFVTTSNLASFAECFLIVPKPKKKNPMASDIEFYDKDSYLRGLIARIADEEDLSAPKPVAAKSAAVEIAKPAIDGAPIILGTVLPLNANQKFRYLRNLNILYRRAGETDCSLCYGDDCFYMEEEKCEYYSLTSQFLDEAEIDTRPRAADPELRLKVDSLLTSLALSVSATADNLDCVPYISQYTDCNKENICTGCKSCACDPSGRWNCSLQQHCNLLPPMTLDEDILALVQRSIKGGPQVGRRKRWIRKNPTTHAADSDSRDYKVKWLHDAVPSVLNEMADKEERAIRQKRSTNSTTLSQNLEPGGQTEELTNSTAKEYEQAYIVKRFIANTADKVLRKNTTAEDAADWMTDMHPVGVPLNDTNVSSEEVTTFETVTDVTNIAGAALTLGPASDFEVIPKSHDFSDQSLDFDDVLRSISDKKVYPEVGLHADKHAESEDYTNLYGDNKVLPHTHFEENDNFINLIGDVNAQTDTTTEMNSTPLLQSTGYINTLKPVTEREMRVNASETDDYLNDEPDYSDDVEKLESSNYNFVKKGHFISLLNVIKRKNDSTSNTENELNKKQETGTTSHFIIDKYTSNSTRMMKTTQAYTSIRPFTYSKFFIQNENDKQSHMSFETNNIEYIPANIVKRDVSHKNENTTLINLEEISTYIENITLAPMTSYNTEPSNPIPDELRDKILNPLNSILENKKRELEVLLRMKMNLLSYIKNVTGIQIFDNLNDSLSESKLNLAIYKLEILPRSFHIDRADNISMIDRYILKLRRDVHEVIRDIIGIQKHANVKKLPIDLIFLIQAMKGYIHKRHGTRPKENNEGKGIRSKETRRQWESYENDSESTPIKDTLGKIIEVINMHLPESRTLNSLSKDARKIVKRVIRNNYHDEFFLKPVKDYEPNYNLSSTLQDIGSNWQDMTQEIAASDTRDRLYKMKMLHITLLMDINKMNKERKKRLLTSTARTIKTSTTPKIRSTSLRRPTKIKISKRTE